MPNENNSGILIYAQVTREKYIHTVFFELLSKAKELSVKLNGVEVNAVIFTPNGLIDSFKESFQIPTNILSFGDICWIIRQPWDRASFVT